MDIFTDGKKVSEQNIVITKDEGEDALGKELDPMAQMFGGKDGHPLQILDAVKNEPVFNDFL